MRPTVPPRRRVFAALLAALAASTASARDEPKPESAYVKLLKKAPEERLAQVVDIVGKRGMTEDLAYLYGRAIAPEGFTGPVRLKCLEALADAATSRGLRPEVDLKGLAGLIRSADSRIAADSRLAAIRLAGAWRAGAIVPELLAVAGSEKGGDEAQAPAFDALAAIGDGPARDAIEALGSAGRPARVRALAVAALARLDLDSAAEKAAATLTDDAKIEDVTPLMAAFLDRRQGAEKLAGALGRRPPSADGARLGLRALYALGRSDESLVAILGKSAGLEAEPRPPTKEQMETLVAEVATRGDPARGEMIFRRAELNCVKCHALGGAGGGVGPDLSAIGLSSPVDYVINSILVPDQAVKEEFQVRTILTDDGRVFQGIVVEEDDRRIRLKDASGETRVVAVPSIEDSKRGGSLMPKGLASLLTRGEFADLVRFLSELGKPGPYAIPGTPTIQRWRVLKSSPVDVAEVFWADPGSWAPGYAMVGGTLPLADLKALGGGPIVYVEGEIAVSTPGSITFRLDSARGLNAFLDGKPLPGGETSTVDLASGTHRLTLRVDIPARDRLPIRVEVARPAGSSVEFSVVGGR